MKNKPKPTSSKKPKKKSSPKKSKKVPKPRRKKEVEGWDEDFGEQYPWWLHDDDRIE